MYERKLWKNKEASHIYVEFIKFVEKNIDFICSYRVQQWSGKVDKEDTVGTIKKKAVHIFLNMRNLEIESSVLLSSD